ncbi:MAG: hypothetical protein J5962_02585 [Lachnospiraceae bacterium]|nr:hypothetical protein [Lachnospiraceae bacterium]
MNNIKRFMVLGTLFTMCFLFVTNTYEVNAKAYSCESYVSADGIIMADYDIPNEVKEPVEKGKSLVKYLLYAFCGIVALVGIIMAVVGSLRHNPDISANGWKVVGIAVVGFVAVAVINWLVPDAKL